MIENLQWKKALGQIYVIGLLYINCTLFDFSQLVQDLTQWKEFKTKDHGKGEKY